MTRKNDGRGRRAQVAADLRAYIMAGDLGDPFSSPPGQLPITSVLAESFDTTGDTIHHAIEILKSEDLVYGIRGKGVYVRDWRRYTIEADPYFDPKATAFDYRVLDVNDCPAPADVAEALGVARGTLVVRRRRLMLLKDTGQPVELSWSYHPAELAHGTRLADARKLPGGSPAVLADLGHPQLGWADHVSTRPPTKEEVELLELPEHVSVLRTLRRIHSHNDVPVEVTVMVKGGNLFELKYTGSAH